MNEPSCEKEQQLVAAVFDGSRDPELFGHARNCPICSEVLLVTEFLREDMRLSTFELSTLPDPVLIRQKAQALSREIALARATLPIRIARICAFVVAVLATPWIVLEASQLWPWVVDVWPGHLQSTNPPWPSDLNESTLLLAITGTLICIGLSSWYILREE